MKPSGRDDEKPTLQEVIEQHRRFVRAALAHMGVRSCDLADVEQEVFRGVNRGLPSFDPSLATTPELAVRAWLYRICERQAANYRRRVQRRGEVLIEGGELDGTEAAGPDNEEQLVLAQRRALLAELLATLEPNRRAVIVAYELDGLEMVEVAELLNIPVNTAWNRLRLAREDLRAALARKSTTGRY